MVVTDSASQADNATSSSEREWTRRSWLSACGIAASALSGQTQSQSGKIRVLLVTGGHDHEPCFYSIFDDQAGMTVNVNPHPGAFRSDPTEDYDVVALYDLVQIEDIEAPKRKNLQAFVESGKGLVVLHHALCSYNSWEWWWRDVIGARYLEKPDGNTPASTYKHGQLLKITSVRAHPVLEGIGAFEVVDETYKGMWISASNHLLLKTDNPTSDGPLAWVSAYEKSRVVVIQPGHGREAHAHPGYRRLVRNAMLWTAGAAKTEPDREKRDFRNRARL
jgi:type 1 glutamine amidotransferase